MTARVRTSCGRSSAALSGLRPSGAISAASRSWSSVREPLKNRHQIDCAPGRGEIASQMAGRRDNLPRQNVNRPRRKGRRHERRCCRQSWPALRNSPRPNIGRKTRVAIGLRW